MFNRFTRSLLFPILVLPISLLFLSPAEAMIYVSGRIVTGANGAPAKGVVVSLFPEGATAANLTLTPSATTQSLENGAYVLTAPTAGKYRVVAAEPNFLPLEPAITVPRGGVSGVNLRFAPAPTLNIKLQRPDGAPVRAGMANGWVWLLWDHRAGTVIGLNNRGRWNRGGAWRGVPLRSDGMLHITPPPSLPLQDISAGSIDVSVPSVGVGTLKISRWTEDPLTLTLAAGANLNGSVVDEAGKPVVGADVSAIRIAPETFILSPGGNGRLGQRRRWGNQQNRFSSAIPTTLTDQQGHYTLSGLFHDHYLIRIARPNGVTQDQLVQVSAKTADLTTRWGVREAPNAGMDGGNNVFEGQVPLTNIIEHLDPAGSKAAIALTGRVVDSVTGAALPGVGVTLYGSSPFGEFQFNNSTPPFQPFDETIAGSNGDFSLRALGGRQYGVRVELDGYRILQSVITGAARTAPSLTLRLHPVSSVTLKLSALNGMQVPKNGAQGYVVVNWGSAIIEGEPVSPNVDGDIVIQAPRWDIPLGETSRDEPVSVTLAARSPVGGYAIQHLQKWPASPLLMRLGPAATLSGLIVDENGHPVPNVPLLVTRTAHTPDQLALPELPIFVPAKSDAAGRFVVTALPRGSYSITESYGGRAFRALIVHLTGDRLDVTVRPVEQ